MLLPKKIRGPKKIFLLSVMAVLVGVTAYLVYDNFLKDLMRPSAITEIQVTPLVVPTINTKFETSFLSQEPYTRLEENGNLPVEIGALGRPNPFQSIPFSILEQ
ncbi:MAG: hypothetical protein HUU49_02795 [Candidatus Buchananbacteria bacterium]|nr:hypothetical protein [Candidatus Buchananbacteria bacterium]